MWIGVVGQAGSYTNFFADALIAEADRDSRVVGIHAAMGGGTGMNRFEARFPDRTYDVGIAEQVRHPCPFPLSPAMGSLGVLYQTILSRGWVQFTITQAGL